ncbi:hypothetical protein D3C85_1305600 [compost metagenome]
MELEGAEDHQVRRLFDLPALTVDIGHAGGFGLGAVEVDPQHVGIGPQLEIRQRLEGRQNIHVRRCLGVHVANVTAAKTAEVARSHLRAVRVGVGARSIR